MGGDGGAGRGDTTTDCVPAVLPLEHTTITVYVPALTLDQAADCPADVPDSAAWRPCEKFAWPLLSSEAVPQWPLIWVHAEVLTETVFPVVLTEIPSAAAGPA